MPRYMAMRSVHTSWPARLGARGWNRVRSFRSRILCAVFAGVTAASSLTAQTQPPAEQRAREIAVTTGGAMDLPGGAAGGEYWATQLRFGRVMFAPVGPGFLRGTLEAAMEVEPAVLIRQRETILGIGVTPSLLQWNFAAPDRVIPFIQVGSGMLLTTAKFPRGTSHFNFTPQGGIGVYWFRSPRRAWILGLRYHHTSNAGFTKFNPGHNALYFYAGLSWWR